MELIYDGDSDCELRKKLKLSWVIFLMARKSRSLKLIARFDNYDEDDCEYKEVFLQKVKSKMILGWEVKNKLLLLMKKMLLHSPLMTMC